MVLKNNNCNRNLKGMDMKKRLSRKQMFFNKINLTKDDEVYVGIDVHKKSHSVEIWLRGFNALLKTPTVISTGVSTSRDEAEKSIKIAPRSGSLHSSRVLLECLINSSRLI